MAIVLSDREAAILLGATLTHWGVPFRFSTKRPLSDREQAVIDEASDKLIALREAFQQTPHSGPGDVPLSAEEVSLLAEVVTACLAECGDDPVELELQLKTRARAEVEALLERLRHLGPGAERGAAPSDSNRR